MSANWGPDHPTAGPFFTFSHMAQPGEYDYLPAHVLEAANRYHAMTHGWVTTDEIVAGLFLGPMEARKKVDILQISLVVSAVTDLDRGHPDYVKETTAANETRLVIDDDEHDALPFDMLARTAGLIHAVLSGGKRVLVHCMAGRSRSTSIVIAYLLAAGLASSSDVALDLIVKKRACARPNNGFMQQLRDMEARLYNILGSRYSFSHGPPATHRRSRCEPPRPTG